MARTYLQLVNDVLIRLRETPVATVVQTPYSAVIGALVNDAKREVEDAWQWSHLLDYLSFSTVAGTSSYETNTMATRYSSAPLSAPNGAGERTRLWLDSSESVPLLFNITSRFENRLVYEPTLFDYVHHQTVFNASPSTRAIPTKWQVAQSTNSLQAGYWNKTVWLYDIPDGIYSMQLFVVNPQGDLLTDADVMKVPSAPVVQKAYLYSLYERGEELGETLTLTAQKVENTLSDAVSLDQSQQQSNWQLIIPYGGKY